MATNDWFVIVIRRYVRPECEGEFLDIYHRERAVDPAFVRETLTKLLGEDSDLLPEPKALDLKPDCLNYLNIAVWRDLEAFKAQCDMTADYYDPRIEVAPRERQVLRVASEVLGERS